MVQKLVNEKEALKKTIALKPWYQGTIFIVSLAIATVLLAIALAKSRSRSPEIKVDLVTASSSLDLDADDGQVGALRQPRPSLGLDFDDQGELRINRQKFFKK